MDAAAWPMLGSLASWSRTRECVHAQRCKYTEQAKQGSARPGDLSNSTTALPASITCMVAATSPCAVAGPDSFAACSRVLMLRLLLIAHCRHACHAGAASRSVLPGWLASLATTPLLQPTFSMSQAVRLSWSACCEHAALLQLQPAAALQRHQQSMPDGFAGRLRRPSSCARLALQNGFLT